MRTLTKITATMGVIGAIAASSAVPAAADWYYGHRHHGYYNYYGGGGWRAGNSLPTGLDGAGRRL